MENPQEMHYIKRTQKNYLMSFKLQVIQDIEQGEVSIHSGCRIHGIQ